MSFGEAAPEARKPGALRCDRQLRGRQKNEWAAYGYSRDKTKGKKQIVFGLMTDQEGCPVSVEVLVGDRGILKQKQIEEELRPAGLDWITAMQKSEIRQVVEQTDVQMSLFGQQDLMEVCCDLYPDERLILCKNPFQAEKNKRTREELLAKTEVGLDKIVEATRREQRRLKDAGKIGVRVGRVLAKNKTTKFFTLDIQEEQFSYTRNDAAIQKAEQLNGLYAIRSSLKPDPEAAELVTSYKRLSTVERAFRTMKRISLQVRPIHHRTKDRVTAHVFLCMLAYYVEYHLRQKLAPMLFAEDDPQGKQAQRKSVVEPAKPSEQATRKARTKQTSTGEKPLSFEGLMEELSGLCRMAVIPKITTDKSAEVNMIAGISPTQKQAFKLLNVKPI